ncbi:MAG: 2-amino-4-hydroxy-6-hydroxymethyldihydropteridine diphosphokinase [Bacteroidetes bacterium]|nr:2-amino-4-hydroxy-6-hydroxymethyldihydropteridine diphosphokinase [Bacteroidota bacterium]MCB0844835.1 2-amino-4-hydroxy-6-hydroxymethyldihydropteridine diphosphokinase [Bacteroidota bacterium]
MIFLGLGSNIGEKTENIRAAIKSLANSGVEILRCSSLYITPPWGILSQDEFINMVCEVGFSGTAEELLKLVLKTEEDMGRYRYYKWGPRLIDIDILEFKREVYDLEHLKIPHPYYPERPFVMVPLRDLEPDWKPTGQDRTISQILENFSLEGIEKLPEDYKPIF